MKFNISDSVRVKLTTLGREIVKAKFGPRFTVKEKDGWSTWQLWELMEVFGPYIETGRDLPFETEIEIVEEE